MEQRKFRSKDHTRHFGEQGVIDLTAVNGYYSFNAMILNVARTALPAAANAELQPFPR